ncbi:MAG: hypothetical protein QM607_01945 [Microbacterium sp.]
MRVAPIIGSLLIGVAVAGACVVFGVEPLFCAGWGLTIAAVVSIVLLRRPATDRPALRGPRPDPPPGRRNDVRSISWSIDTRRGTLGPSLHRRVLQLIQTTLRDHGVDPTDERAVRGLLGDGAARVCAGDALTPGGLNEVLRSIEQVQRRKGPNEGDDR